MGIASLSIHYSVGLTGYFRVITFKVVLIGMNLQFLFSDSFSCCLIIPLLLSSLCPFPYNFLIFFCVCVCLLFLWATPAAYGDSQARGLIGAVAASLRQSHSNADPSRVCNLHHSSRPRQINPLSKGRDQTRNLMVPSRIR